MLCDRTSVLARSDRPDTPHRFMSSALTGAGRHPLISATQPPYRVERRYISDLMRRAPPSNNARHNVRTLCACHSERPFSVSPIPSAATKVSAAAKQQHQDNDNQDQFHCRILVWDVHRPDGDQNARLGSCSLYRIDRCAIWNDTSPPRPTKSA
jgi:hypothetical protein